MRKLVASAVLVVAMTAPTFAHHPFGAEYDWKKPVTVTGTVTKFEWTNPHSVLVVQGKDDHGATGTWTVELGGPAQLTHVGWKRTQFKSGDEVTVDGWAAKDGGKKLSAKSVTAGGHEWFAASSFFDSSAKEPTRVAGPSGKATGTSKN